jgi:hypothetical protein
MLHKRTSSREYNGSPDKTRIRNKEFWSRIQLVFDFTTSSGCHAEPFACHSEQSEESIERVDASRRSE